jgi:hypothetical protein
MFKKIALVAMLAAGSLQAGFKETATQFGSAVKAGVLSPYCLNANRPMYTKKGKQNLFSTTNTALNTVNAVSRIALLTQVARAGLAAKKAEAGKKWEAAKEVLTSKVTVAAATTAVLAVLFPMAYDKAVNKKDADA